MKIACVIPTYNNFKLLKGTLKSIFFQTRMLDDVFVIDNASDDNTSEVKKIFPEVKYIRLDKNVGSAGAYYEGLKLSKDMVDFVFLSDDDNVFSPDSLANLEETMLELDKEENVGAVKCAWDGYKSNAPRKVKSSVWSGMLVKTSVINKIGLPRKEFFIYSDDVEYCYRMRKYGFLIYVAPTAKYFSRYSGHKQQVAFLGKQFSFYKTPFRIYYAFRNEVYVDLRYNKVKLVKLFLYFLKIFPFLGYSKCMAAIVGIKDGVLGKLGENKRYIVER